MTQIDTRPDRASTYRTPRWVKVIGIMTLVLALLIGIVLLTGGEHGPGRHQPSVTESVGEHVPPIEHAGQP